jgi:hypothetical protein
MNTKFGDRKLQLGVASCLETSLIEKFIVTHHFISDENPSAHADDIFPGDTTVRILVLEDRPRTLAAKRVSHRRKKLMKYTLIKDFAWVSEFTNSLLSALFKTFFALARK